MPSTFFLSVHGTYSIARVRTRASRSVSSVPLRCRRKVQRKWTREKVPFNRRHVTRRSFRIICAFLASRPRELVRERANCPARVRRGMGRGGGEPWHFSCRDRLAVELIARAVPRILCANCSTSFRPRLRRYGRNDNRETPGSFLRHERERERGFELERRKRRIAFAYTGEAAVSPPRPNKLAIRSVIVSPKESPSHDLHSCFGRKRNVPRPNLSVYLGNFSSANLHARGTSDLFYASAGNLCLL